MDAIITQRILAAIENKRPDNEERYCSTSLTLAITGADCLPTKTVRRLTSPHRLYKAFYR